MKKIVILIFILASCKSEPNPNKVLNKLDCLNGVELKKVSRIDSTFSRFHVRTTYAEPHKCGDGKYSLFEEVFGIGDNQSCLSFEHSTRACYGLFRTTMNTKLIGNHEEYYRNSNTIKVICDLKGLRSFSDSLNEYIYYVDTFEIEKISH